MELNKKINCIDLCAGIGGVRRGFELTGKFNNVLSVEIDKFAIETYKHLYGEDPTGDVTNEEFKQKVININYDLLLAGFPCQAFSRAGHQNGFLDTTRGSIFFDIADIINRSRPKMFMLENVDNLLTHDKGNTFKVILETLIHELDYSIVGVDEDEFGNLKWEKDSFLRNSRNFGIPQNRPRIYIMGFDNKYFGKKNLTNAISPLPKGRNDLNLYNDLNDLLEPNAPIKYYLASGMLETLENHKNRHKGRGNGFGYMVVNDPEIKNPVSNAILATGGSGKERNIVKDSLEYAGCFAPHKKTPINTKGLRYMTPREWGKLQGFINYAFIDADGNDNFSFPENISDTQQYKQFGNSVTIPVIEAMANHMLKILDQLHYFQKEH